MEKPSYKLVGAPCGQHGQYTFYKAIRLTGERERIVAIGDFFFVRIWQDSELVSIGELQLLWTDRVSDQTLVSLRLYFLPENTPDGRSQHGEDEVLAINDKVVVRAEDLLSWVCEGAGWRWGLRAVWRGACAPPADPRTTAPLHHTKLDFSDVEREKNAITVNADSAGVMVFSYPRYCRYRALLSRLEGIQADWLRDSLVAALGGYAAPTKNTRILYCKETFEYPELEGHEFVCNHLAPRLKGRPRGRRRRQRSRSVSRSDSEEPQPYDPPIRGPLPPPGEQTLRRLSLRNGAPKSPQSEEEPDERSEGESKEERDFLQELRQFYRARNESFKTLKHLSLRALYAGVASRGGYEAVCRARLWRALSPERPARARRHYERFLLPFENHERKNGSRLFHKIANGRLEEPKTIDTIEVHDSPLREVETSADLPDKRLRTPSPRAAAARDARVRLDNETGEVIKADEPDVTSKPAEELNREFLDSLPKEEKPLKITLKPVEKLLDGQLMGKMGDADGGGTGPGFHLNELTQKLSLASADAALMHQPAAGERRALNGHFAPALAAHHAPQPSPADQRGSRPAGRSSLRAVRVKPTRPLAAAAATPPVPPPPLRPDSASCSPQPGSLNNFGIHHPPPAAPGAPSAQPSAAPAASAAHSDDEIVEVPYKPKTPEIIDLDEYPESPQSVKKKKLDILKERGLEVTAVPPAWAAPTTLGAPLPAPLAATLAGPLIGPPPIILSPAVQHQIMTQAQLLHMYNIIPPSVPNGVRPPKVIQATSIYGTTGPEKTVYGNPKDPFMPPPHVLRGAPVRWARGLGALPSAASPSASAPQLARDPLDLTCRPAVEIMRVPPAAPASQPATTATTTTSAANSYTLLDGKALVGSNLEITLVGPKHTPPKRPPQKRSSNGKFVSSKTPTPPRPQLAQPQPAKSPLVVPNYQLSQEVAPLVDPAYVSAFCGGLGRMDQRQLAAYRDLVANQFRGYSGLLNIGTPTTKN